MIVQTFKKHFISTLLTIAACLMASSAGAQSWVSAYGNPANVCVYTSQTTGSGACACPQLYTYGESSPTGENCSTKGDNTNDGCWNPTGCGGSYTGGECCTCGYGGTIDLSIAGFTYYRACFGGTNGEANANGQDPTLPTGPTCTTNSDCTSWNNNASSGGFAQQPVNLNLNR